MDKTDRREVARLSDYQQFLQERDRVDFFIKNGFKIKKVTENLSGAFVLFEKEMDSGEKEVETIQIVTADARKYFSMRCIQQQKGLA